MPSELENMLTGNLYDPSDPDLLKARRETRKLFHAFNQTSPEDEPKRKAILKKLIPKQGKNLYIEPPFQCDYGTNIHIGDRVFFNFNCVILDPALVTIGNDVLFAPAVQIYTATHPLDYKVRRQFLESALPITIGNDVWIGGGAIICPGVTIGERSIIGAGSVVTRDIPSDVVAVGNPCKVIKKLA